MFRGPRAPPRARTSSHDNANTPWGTGVVPGSHKGGALDHSEVWMVGDRQDMTVPETVFDRNAEESITMKMGDCSFHHSLLLHRSGPNNTPHRRRGLATHYMSAQSRWTGAPEDKPEYLLLRGREFPGCV